MSEKLPLTSAKWAALTHAYGEASDIPDLLSELAEAETLGNETADEPMFTLWSSLCHQDNVYPASFAAVPHLVEIAAAKKDA